MRPLWALLWTMACHGLFQLIAYAFSRFRESLDIVTLGLAQALAYVSCIFLMLHVHEPNAPLRQSLGLRPTHPGLGLVGIGLGLSLKLPAESLTSFTERYFPTSEAQLLSRLALYRTDDLGALAGLIAVLCLAAPLVEELFFRGASYGRLVKYGRGVAGAVSGVTFVVVHPDMRHWPALCAVALVLSYLRVIGGSLLPCLGLHVAFNAAGVYALVTDAASPTRPLEISTLALLASWLVLGLLLVLLVRLADNPHSIRARGEDRA